MNIICQSHLAVARTAYALNSMTDAIACTSWPEQLTLHGAVRRQLRLKQNSHQQDNSHAWVSPARERPPVSPFAAQQFQAIPCDAVCSITVKSSASQDMRQCDSLSKERSLSFVYAC